MHTKALAALCAAIATAVIALDISTVTARNLSLSNQNIRVTFNNLEFSPGFGEPSTCRVTLEGSFHNRTSAKVAGSLIGYLTRVTTGQCSPNQVTILTATLPWHVRYQAFSGRLPDISLILAKVFGESLRVGPCLARGDVDFGAARDPVTRELIGVEVPTQQIAVTNTEFFCPIETVQFNSNGLGSIFLSNSSTRVSLTLI